MKNVIILFLMLFSTIIYSQDIKQTRTLTNAEEFAAKSGSLIERVWADIGKIKGVEVRIVTYTDLISKKSVPSLRFEKDVYSSYTKSTDT